MCMRVAAPGTMGFPSGKGTLQWGLGKPATAGPTTVATPMGTKYIVRHGTMRPLGEFEAAEGAAYARGQQVVVRTDRGQEVAEALYEALPQMVELISEPTHGQILRAMTADDQAQAERRRE